jgi:hypothetical protein
LSTGQPVAPHVVRVPPEQLAKAPVTPHPPVNPTVRAAVPGRPRPAPPVHPVNLAVARSAGNSPAVPPRTPPTRAVQAPTPAGDRRPLPPDRAPGVHPAPKPPAGSHAAPVPSATALPRFITRTPPPPASLPFNQRREAMADHPGRPLEPPQIDNLRSGRAVGPMRDREFPPHAAPAIRERMPLPTAGRPPVENHPKRHAERNR